MTAATAKPAPTSARSRSVIFRDWEVRAALAGRKTRVTVPVTAPRGILLYDLGRAWADHGFPTDEAGEVLPMDRWAGGSDPAPESMYREHYLHVPFTHPEDGWELEPRHDRRTTIRCPLGRQGDTLWVRETWRHHFFGRDGVNAPGVMYAADMVMVWHAQALPVSDKFWRPSTSMPEWAARLRYTIASVRPHRLHEITAEDLLAEGLEDWALSKDVWIGPGYEHWIKTFARLWDARYGKRPGLAWADNGWAWSIAYGPTPTLTNRA